MIVEHFIDFNNNVEINKFLLSTPITWFQTKDFPVLWAPEQRNRKEILYYIV